ncbi:MAG: hypothetical protein M3P16_03035 [Chloroflexota bacterium]|nr:hypothetical protein [Chloroflexota bacterium]
MPKTTRNLNEAVTGQPFFLTLAGISLSLAGFAGLLASFRQPSQPWTVTDLWRLRRIVNRSFASVFLALAPVPLFGIVGDEAAAIRIASALFGAVVFVDLVMLTPEWRRLWPGDRELYVAWLISGTLGLLLLANVAMASTGVYELGLGLVLLWPAAIFMRVLRGLRAESG